MNRDDFFKALHPTGYHDLRALDNATKTVKTVANYAADDLNGINKFVNTYAKHWDIYTGIATRNASGHKLQDCLALHTLFADLDFKETPEQEARARLAEFQLKPSAVVASGGGLHCYWFINPPLDLRLQSGNEVKRLLRALAKSLGADFKSVDAAHILRVPGTLNHKYSPPRPVILETLDRSLVYSIDDILRWIDLGDEDAGDEIREDDAPRAKPDVSPKEKIRQAREFLIRQKPAIQGQGGDAHTFNICGFMVNGFDLNENDAYIALSKWNTLCEPPWSEKELREKIRNADRYSKGTRGSLLEPERERIIVKGGFLTSIVNQAETSLLNSNIPIYNRGGMLTRPITLDKQIDDSIRREAGTVMLIGVKEPWLLESMGKVARWIQKTQKGPKHVDPPATYARTLLNRGEWRFPILRGVLTGPTLDRDGRIIQRPGFDPQSGLLLDFPPGVFPSIPESPSQDEAHTALQRLMYPLRQFPFVTDAAKSVALSAMLTALVRPSLRTSPLHGFDAPTAGT